MCIIIDACTIPLVFNNDDPDFSPVYDWLFNGSGKMVFGGSIYSKELSKLGRYIGLIQELSRINKVVVVNKGSVDICEKRIKKIEPKRDFDDSHIVAIVEESGCRIVCTKDARSDKYLKDKRFYDKSKKPSIYRSKKHSKLLSCKNIVAICK